uniref:Secreted protein n=1 Tax=Panagrellus redivivus TaxID=6233 RepID=A0A7E4VT97_PANRE
MLFFLRSVATRRRTTITTAINDSAIFPDCKPVTRFQSIIATRHLVGLFNHTNVTTIIHKNVNYATSLTIQLHL